MTQVRVPLIFHSEIPYTLIKQWKDLETDFQHYNLLNDEVLYVISLDLHKKIT